jgi:fructose-1,6-bisphosphatase/inositol monophosphatase family enzyme
MDILAGRSLSLPQEIRESTIALNIGTVRVQADVLLQNLFVAVSNAWEKGIKPRLSSVRAQPLTKDAMKHGADFFTEADVASEKLIIETITSAFGPNTFRIFAEESGLYTGNVDSSYTVRIDPIDSTESFKFGKPNWSIMVGVYSGRGSTERQIASVVYYPEYFNEVLYRCEGLGVFIADLNADVTEKIKTVTPQDSLGDMLTVLARGQDAHTRAVANAITLALEKAGARVKSSSSIEAKEALQTGGKRAIITNTSFDSVDYIAFSSLVSLGYKAYDFKGREWNIDDEGIQGRGIAILPPGSAGAKILDAIKTSV